jgi:long-chain-alcohol oxidase
MHSVKFTFKLSCYHNSNRIIYEIGCVDCGSCSLGCCYGAKQSTLTAQLDAVVETGRLFLLPDCHVDSITFTADGLTANGVRATITSTDGKKQPIIASSKIVVCSAGSLHTPAVLLRSGLKNWHIGRHLSLHPVVGCAGIFGNDELRSFYGKDVVWDSPTVGEPSTGLSVGVSMGIVVRSDVTAAESSVSKAAPILCGRELTAELTRERTHGIWKNIPAIETPPVHPALLGTVLPWDSGLSLKLGLLLRNHTAAFIGISRDLSSAANRVTVNADGQPVLTYNLTASDGVGVIEGMDRMLKMMRGAGANVVFPMSETMYWFDTKGKTEEEFGDYLKSVKAKKIVKNQMGIFSAHQMGTCRMAISSSDGVVQPTGETFEKRNVFVADGSVLPTSLGINPMITIEAFAVMIADSIIVRLQGLPRSSTSYKTF